MRRNLIVLAILLASAGANGQGEEKKRELFEFRGYLKYMHIASFTTGNASSLTSDQLLHNRLNFKFFPTKSITGALELRNRIFYGETVKGVPGYGQLLDFDPGYADLSWLAIDDSLVVGLVQADRVWFQWENEKWLVRAGRQRINWGINLFWNANDLFNAFALADFDYEERPGSDAIRIQRKLSGMSDLEVAVAPSDNKDKWIAAAKWTFNKAQYDWQILAGNYHRDVAVGLGWAGNIKTAGFKGEATWFQPKTNNDTIGVLSASIALDYVAGEGVYTMAGVLYNSAGQNAPGLLPLNAFSGVPSAKNLMPARFSFIGQVSKAFNPITNGALVAVYSPGVNTVFVMPSLGYSLHEDWDIGLFGQMAWTESTTTGFTNIGNGVFLRLRWSF